ERLKNAIRLSEEKPERLPLIIDRIYAQESEDKKTETLQSSDYLILKNFHEITYTPRRTG
ncbi:MAG: hypothetical protein VX964_06575, partial [Verrucomicrobiota bacterium]|nr:hypothetical protein [Verrucomicrobiota bacterium]